MSSRSSLQLSTRSVQIYSGAADAQARADIAGHVANNENPHDVTADQIGLGDVDNTSDANKPVSAPQAAALVLKAPLVSPALSGVPTAPTAPLGTATLQLASTAFVQAAVNLVGNDVGEVGADLDNHLADHANPHQVTKAQVGLALADNTADAAKPVSGPQQAAINVASAAAAAAQADIDGHQANTANPHGVTKGQIGLESVDNTADLAKPVSSPQQAAINVAAAIGSAAQADIDGHQADVANPHGVTKSQVGLANVDNTSDLAKPVSTATQTALNLKANLASPALTGAPTAPTAAIGTSSTQVATTAFADAIGDALTASLGAHTGNIANPHAVTKSQVGLGSVDNTSDAGKPVSTAQAAALALKAPLASPALTGAPTAPTAAVGTSTTQLATTAFADAIGDALTASLGAHTGNVSNPHATTKAQVGLGSVDNTSDANKPVSTAQAAALALKAPLVSPALTGTPTAPTAAPGTSTGQVATTAFVRASIDGASGSSERPGDAVALYGTLATGTAAAMPRVDPTWVATSAAGNVVRVNSATADDPQVIAPAAAFAVGPVYDLRWQVQRQTDPIDPLNDSVTLAIRWLTNTYAGVAGAAGISTIANLALVAAGGVVSRTARIGGGGLVPPAGAVYFRPYVQAFGDSHVTDVIVLGVDEACSRGIAIVTLLTASTALPAGTTGLVLVSAATAMTVTLPPTPTLGQTLTIKDAAGNAATRNITVAGGGANIDGAAGRVLNFNYGWLPLAWSGTQWLQV